MTHSIATIKEQIRNIYPSLRKDYHVQKMGIFGSVARNQAKPTSDVDILVSFSQTPGFFKFIRLENHLQKLLNCRVDLVTKEGLKPLAKPEIIKDVIYV